MRLRLDIEQFLTTEIDLLIQNSKQLKNTLEKQASDWRGVEYINETNT